MKREEGTHDSSRGKKRLPPDRPRKRTDDGKEASVTAADHRQRTDRSLEAAL